MDNTTIKIICAPDISDDFIKEFNSDSQNIPLTKSPFSGDNFEHFDGEAFKGIVIYIATHQTDIFVNGVFFPLLIQTLTRFYDKIKSTKKPDVEIEFKDRELEIEFKIKGPTDSKTIDNAIKEFAELCKHKTYLKHFKNPDLVTNENGKPKIRMTFNSKTNQYEPTNFKALRQYFIDQFNKASERFNG
ncbi:MAG: hypothetical protein ACYDEC_05180 [Bacteroidia bacterium]